MKDNISQCLSSGIAFILSNWVFDEAFELTAENLNEEIDDFISCVSGFIAIEDWKIGQTDYGTNSHTVDVVYRVNLDEEPESRVLRFHVLRGSVVVS